MIGKLTGIVDSRELERIIIDVGGVGYELVVPQSTERQLPSVGRECTLHVHTHVREDAILLYGFSTKEEKELFQTLIAVSGVGPKLALSVLSSMTPPTFKLAVVNQDIKQLSTIPGIGKRTAERLSLELKDKFKIDPDVVDLEPDTTQSVPGDVYADALAALQALGYTLDEAESALQAAGRKLATDGQKPLSTENLISQALKAMA
ncbi:MAG: Holliday junction branch migration protein RuvA [Firmicutes bacterium]|nr:Holliday junction branch migration protein RuvA [Bacillota bacterium]